MERACTKYDDGSLFGAITIKYYFSNLKTCFTAEPSCIKEVKTEHPTKLISTIVGLDTPLPREIVGCYPATVLHEYKDVIAAHFKNFSRVLIDKAEIFMVGADAINSGVHPSTYCVAARSRDRRIKHNIEESMKHTQSWVEPLDIPHCVLGYYDNIDTACQQTDLFNKDFENTYISIFGSVRYYDIY
nr:hypothetical protein [Abalone asfa-like virus]